MLSDFQVVLLSYGNLIETRKITKVFQLWEVIKDETMMKGLMLKQLYVFPVNSIRLLQLISHLIIYLI